MDIQLPQILFQLVNFGVVVGALTYFLYRPVLKILDERSQKIEQAQKAAETTLQEQSQLEITKKKAKSEAEKQAAAIIAEAKENAEKVRKQILADAKVEAKAEVAKLQEQWRSEQSKMARNMQQEFADAVLAVTEKVLGKALDKKAHQQLIDQEVKALLKAA